MQRRTHAGLTMALAALLVAGLLAYAPAPTEAVIKCVRISAVQFDPPVNPLNEWVRVKNRCRKSKNLRGWTIHGWGPGARNRAYRFKGNSWVRPGATITLYTKEGRDSRTKRYWNYTKPVWRDCDDDLPERAYLRNRKGKLVHSRSDCRRWSLVAGRERGLPPERIGLPMTAALSEAGSNEERTASW